MRNISTIGTTQISQDKYALDTFSSSVKASYTLRKVKIGTQYACRVRNDALVEKDIGFVGENLDVVSLLNHTSPSATLVNLLGTDGNFGSDSNSDGLGDGWGHYAASTTSISGNIQSFTATSQYANIINDFNGLNIGNKTYLCAYVNSTSNTTNFGIDGGSDIYHNGSGTFVFLSLYSTMNITTGNVYIKDMRASGWTPISVKQVYLFNLTQIFGAGNEPTKANMDIYMQSLSTYFTSQYTTIKGSGYIRTWYDSSGNGNHAHQLTASNQPRIVNQGILERDFDATKCTLLYPTFSSASGVNIVTNGDFSNGTTGWTVVHSTGSATNSTYSQLGNGNNAGPYLYAQTGVIPVTGRRYFVTAKIRVTNSNCNSIELILGDSVIGSSGFVSRQRMDIPIQNQWYTLSTVVTVTSQLGFLRVYVKQNYADASAALNKVMEVQEVTCVDVTDLGNVGMYFDGTDDVMTIANSASVDILGQPLFLNCVTNTQAQDGYVISKNGVNASENQYAILLHAINKNVRFYLEGGERHSTADNSNLQNVQQIYSGIFQNGIQQGYINGTASGGAGNYNAALTSKANMQIGARSNNVGGTAWSIFFKGNISEIIISTNQSTRQKIEKSQSKYYGIAISA